MCLNLRWSNFHSRIISLFSSVILPKPGRNASTINWESKEIIELIRLIYDRAKQRYSTNRKVNLSPSLHLASSTEAGALSLLLFFSGLFCTNLVWLVKTRLQLQNPLHQTRPYSGLYDAFRTIMREEGWLALYKGIVPSLFLVSHGAIQFTAYKKLHKLVIDLKSGKNIANSKGSDKVLNSFDYAALGTSSKIVAILLSYPFQKLHAFPKRNNPNYYLDDLFKNIIVIYEFLTPFCLISVWQHQAFFFFLFWSSFLSLMH
ncbi:hypothetical protein UlMin_033610 [Ulmus minor]